MGLQMSELLLLDPLLDVALRLVDGLGEWTYELDVARDLDEHERDTEELWTRPSH